MTCLSRWVKLKERLAVYHETKFKSMQCTRYTKTNQFRKTANKRIGKGVQEANTNPIKPKRHKEILTSGKVKFRVEA